MTCLIDCHSRIVIFSVNALLNAPSCIIEESSTYLDLIIRYSNVYLAIFDPQLGAPTIFWTSLHLQILLINHSDIIKNFELFKKADNGDHKQNIPYNAPSYSRIDFLTIEHFWSMSHYHCLEVWKIQNSRQEGSLKNLFIDSYHNDFLPNLLLKNQGDASLRPVRNLK